MQKEFKHAENFSEWYEKKQTNFKNDKYSRFFNEKRIWVTKKYYPELQKFTGVVKFYYIGPDNTIRSGSCWAHQSIQPTTIIVPGGTITIEANGTIAKPNDSAILQKHTSTDQYFFSDFLDKPVFQLCEEHLKKLKELFSEWEEMNKSI